MLGQGCECDADVIMDQPQKVEYAMKGKALETYRCSVEKRVIEIWVRGEQLASKKLCILDVLE